MSKFAGVAAALAVTWVAAACSATTAGTPEPGASSSPPTGGSAAPKIEHPLPASLIQGNPCSVLTSAQVNGLFSRPPTHDAAAKDTGVAKSCFWRDVDRGSLIGIQLVYVWKHGLADVYAKRGQGFFKELAPIQGYPIVAYGPADDRAKGACDVAVGIADNAAFGVGVDVASSAVGKGDPCDDARKVADLALTTLKGNA
ncbi:DUF3558 domain-containing protein [Amycolatopsis sulphurea]|uniref:DUF3558 domain-containing protein n=1 Tax=Amycolatopsis sulphurea TaxID=76022 RepID=UPI001474C1C0